MDTFYRIQQSMKGRKVFFIFDVKGVDDSITTLRARFFYFSLFG